MEDDTLSTIWFRRPTWGIKHISLVPEVLKCDPCQSLKSDPTDIQMALGGHLKTHGIYRVEATLGHFWRGWELILFLLVFRAPTFLGF